jgi:hypothetical protein
MRSIVTTMRKYIYRGIGLALLVACGAREATDPTENVLDRIEMSGSFTLSIGQKLKQATDGSVGFSINVVNRASYPITATYGGCWTVVQLYLDSGRTGLPAYTAGGRLGDCDLQLFSKLIAVGDSLALPRTMPKSFFPDLPAGHYFAVVRVAPNQMVTDYSAGDFDFRR